MRSTRFVTAAAWLTAFGLGGVALADAITSPVSEAVDPTFDILNTEVLKDGDFLRFRMTMRGNAGTSLPARTGNFEGSQMYAYIWPTSADSAAAGFPRGQGLLALALVSHPDAVEDVGGTRFSADWHPHWMVLVPAMACGPYGLRVVDGGARPAPNAPPNVNAPAVAGAIAGAVPGGAPLLSTVARLPSAMTGPTVEVRVPAAMMGDPQALRFDGMTATLLVAGVGQSPVMCVRPFDVASGRLVLQGTVTGTAR